MSKKLTILCSLLLPLFMAGCASSSISNLTPSQYPRNASGLYHFEASWTTTQTTIMPETITAAVQIGDNRYEMHHVALVQDRWETFVPIPADSDEIFYHYKFDFMVGEMGGPRPDSLMSKEYKMRIVPPK
jgi:hypothetical protein